MNRVSAEQKSKLPKVVSNIVLLVVILAVSIVLAAATDMGAVLRGVIAVGSGIAAAALSHIITARIAGR